MEILPLHSKINFLTTFLTGKCLTAFVVPFFSLCLPFRHCWMQNASSGCPCCGHPCLCFTVKARCALHHPRNYDLLFFWEVRLWEVPTLTWVPAHLWAHHRTTSEDSQQGHSVLALSSREIHMPAELITLTATEIILAHHRPSEMNISLSYSQGDVNGIFINWWPVDCY